jgi:UTP:GlnB (protein PII) uridylyltransferase
MNAARGVARLEAATGVAFGRLTDVRSETEQRLTERRQRFASVATDVGATVVLMGSWGRRELTSESDDDFMVLFEGKERGNASPTIHDVAKAAG